MIIREVYCPVCKEHYTSVYGRNQRQLFDMTVVCKRGVQ